MKPPKKRKTKTFTPQAASQVEPTRAVLVTASQGKYVIPTSSLSDDDLEDIECNNTINSLLAMIKKGDVQAMRELHRWALVSVRALNKVQDLELVKLFSHREAVWPVIINSSAGARKYVAELFQRIELGRHVQGFGTGRLKNYDTVEQQWIETLLCLIHDICNDVYYLPVEWKNYRVLYHGKQVAVPADLIRECENLPLMLHDPPQEVLDRFWPVVKALFILLTNNKFEELPEFRAKLERSSTRKGAEPRSRAAITLLRSDTLKKLREALITRSGTRQRKAG